jgi:HAD superfamily hydrolase (TIGR01459 family)
MNAPASKPIPSIVEPVPPVLTGLADIASNYDVIFCDVWGVIHNGVASFPKAAEALSRFRAKGGTVILITNAPRPGTKVTEFLDALSVPRTAYDALVSSGDVTISLMRARGDLPLAHIGPAQDMSLFTAAEALSGKPLRLVKLEDAEYVVCTGLFDPEMEAPKDYAGRLGLMRQRELDFICANPDIVVEVGDKLVYCAGALAEAYAAVGGRVIQAGKPYPPIYALAFEAAARISGKPIDRARVLAIGDAMHTDIKGAREQALATLFVTTGIHRSELHAGPRASDLDAAAFRQFFGEAGFAPTAAITHLGW